jgi:hypothetical protein
VVSRRTRAEPSVSYVVHVWEHAAPASFQEALTLHERLSLQRAVAASPKFEALAARLEKRFPCPDDPRADDLGVWTDAPRSVLPLEPVYSLGIASSATDKVVPVVVEEARSLGLTVLDDQAGCIYLPGGGCLGPGAPGQSEAAPPSPASARSWPGSKAEMAATCQQAFKPLLEPAGFKAVRKPASFRRVTGPVEATMQFAVTDYAPRFVIGVAIGLVPTLPEPYAALAARYADACLLDATATAGRLGIVLPGAAGGFDAPATVSGPDGFDALMRQWARLLEAGVLPVLEHCTTLDGLEKEINAQASSFRSLPSALLLAAWLRRPGLGEIAARIAGSGNAMISRQVTALSAELRALGHEI